MANLSLEQLNYCACANVRKTARALTHLYDKAFLSTGLRGTQFSMLAHISTYGPISVSGLGEKMLMDQTTVTRNLKPLRDHSLIKSGKGEDGRTRLVTITTEGEKMLTEMLPLWEQAQEQVIASLGQERFDSLLNDLSSLMKLGL
jgi:DNA-binding MarR family transcriptional regulator